MLMSCGDSRTGATPPNSPIDIIESIPVKIRPSSSGHPWKISYSVALATLLSDAHFSDMLQTEIVSEDLDLIGCSNFNELTEQAKKRFYIAFLAAIAEAESDFETTQKTYNPSDKTMNIGMLQIDHASANRHAYDYFERRFSDDDLKDPELNLRVGAFILKNQITGKIATSRLFPERTYYWQVLSAGNRRVLRNLHRNLFPLGICNR